MSVANWTTRFLAGSAQGRDMPPDGPGRGPEPDGATGKSAPGDAPDSLIGSRVGAYLITKRLGEGGVGAVFKAVDVMLKREVAIKVLRDELASDPHFLERFNQEARLHAQLSHPNVASVHAFLHEGDKQFLVMEYVAGISLDEFIRAGGPVPVERALSIFRRALDGIEHAHHNGIVHRDIKPANIMLADNGQVKVMDFGIARALDSQEHLTRLGQVAGTARAMSPEQIRGAQADVRSDIYSLGIVLYTLLAGRAPFDGETDLALMRAQVEQAPPPLRGRVENLPPAVEGAVMRALEKDPSARFQTVGEFSRALDACIDGLTTTPRPVPDRPDPTSSPRTVLNPAVHDASPRTVVNPAVHHDASSRTVMNPVVHDAPRKLNRRVGAVALAVLALSAGSVLVWPHLARRDAPAAATPASPAVSPAGPQVAAAPPAERAQAAPVPVPSMPEPAASAMPQPTQAPALAPAVVDPVMPRTLTIIRLPSDGPADGRFKPGERVRLRVTTSQDAHLYCYLQDETRRIVRFYPNRFSKSAVVKSHAPLEIPGVMGFEIVANTRNVTETIACFASERDVIAQLPPAVVGTDFESLPATSLAQVRSAFARSAGETLAEASFRVEFK
ncbi:MAG TPA: protein kinase [Burkholderiaceae bacterium]